MATIESKIHGEENSKEKIKVKFIEFDAMKILATRDSKLISLVYAYEHRGKPVSKI